MIIKCKKASRIHTILLNPEIKTEKTKAMTAHETKTKNCSQVKSSLKICSTFSHFAKPMSVTKRKINHI